jgi:hypothetical protein
MNEHKKGVRAKKNKVASIEPSKPRNFVAKNAINAGAGAHKDKKKAMKQGDVKHKKLDYAESLELRLAQKLSEEKIDEFLPVLARMAAGAVVSKALDSDDETEEDIDSPEYNDEAGMSYGSLHTISRAAEGLLDTIKEGDNLPEWCQEKISLAEDYLITVWDYLQSEKEQGVAEGSLELNTPDPVVVIQDLKGNMLDKLNLSVASQKYKLGNPQNIKNQLAHQNYTTIGSYVIVSPMSGQPQDKTTQGVAEGHADQQRRIFKKNGHPVGEVGIDRESSPGNGQWYMKYYPTGDDFGGYDSMEEAVADLKHLVNQFKAEGVAEGGYAHGFADPTAPSLGRRGREDDEYHTPDPVEMQYNIKVNGEVINRQPFANRAEALSWAKQAVASGKLDPKTAKLSPIQGLSEADDEEDYYYVVRHQSKRDIETEMPTRAWDAVGPKYATYEEAKAVFDQLKAEHPQEKFTYTRHPRISNMGGTPKQVFPEGWSKKYKSSINCSHPKGFSQKAHCAGKKKHNEDMSMEEVCPDCGMCETHGNLNEIKKGAKDSNGYSSCWKGYHAAGTKKGKNGGQVRNCVPNEGVAESSGKRCKQCGMIDCPCPGVTCKCKPIAGWEPGKGFKKAMDEAALSEKLNLKAMDTGAVIKDFEKSNAPQFRGKTKEKRKQMAIAAKNSAMKKKKKIGESVEGWTTDSLASHLFEQELTYEDRLNNMLSKKLSK